MRPAKALCATLVTALVVSGYASASEYETAQLRALDMRSGDTFGWSMAISGNAALIGAPQEQYDESLDLAHGGAVYAFDLKDGAWTQVQKLVLPGAAGDWFGYSVDVDGANAIVGAYAYEDLGAVVIYQRYASLPRPWRRVATLQAPNADFGDEFGRAVAIDGAHAIIGAPRHPPWISGAAYFAARARTGWHVTQFVQPTVPDGDYYFGSYVAIDGTHAAVAAPFEFDGSSAGMVYTYERRGARWQLNGVLQSPADGNAFSIMSISGNRMAIGDPRAWNANGDGTGCVFIYEWSGATWDVTARLEAADAVAYQAFGSAVAIDGDRIAIGSDLDNETGDHAGAVYLFEYDGTSWVERSKHVASTPTLHLGTSVGLSGSAMMGGAPDDSRGVPWGGAAFVFQ